MIHFCVWLCYSLNLEIYLLEWKSRTFYFMDACRITMSSACYNNTAKIYGLLKPFTYCLYLFIIKTKQLQTSNIRKEEVYLWACRVGKKGSVVYLSCKRKIRLPSYKSIIGSSIDYCEIHAYKWMTEFGTFWISVWWWI